MPFRPGNGISIYEFFQRFEDWSRGQMSQDQRANVLYNRHLDFSVTDGNKELEDAKGNYPLMKSILLENGESRTSSATSTWRVSKGSRCRRTPRTKSGC